MDYSSTLRSGEKMDDLSQCDTSIFCNFGRHKAVTFCPILF
jgi:hypothetical protein